MGFDAVVGVLPVTCAAARDEFVQYPAGTGQPYRYHLDGRRPLSHRADQESTAGGGVPLFGRQYVDDLPVLVDRPVAVLPPAGDLPCFLNRIQPPPGSTHTTDPL
jgi:hypothetical protein